MIMIIRGSDLMGFWSVLMAGRRKQGVDEKRPVKMMKDGHLSWRIVYADLPES